MAGLFLRGVLGLVSVSGAYAAGSDLSAPKFLGALSCSSSSCHGGAAQKDNQFIVWSKYDFHHERPMALLETRRAIVIGEALGLHTPLHNKNCTACHAPLQTVPAARLVPGVSVREGISCENCHAPAENWMRPHTRPDWTTADRVQAGMRDLRNLYVRANTCVACHQNVDAALRRAGHPALIFELDGQCATEPRHWLRSADQPGPQIWLVGQAVALREISWQLSREQTPDAALRDEADGLGWVLQALGKIAGYSAAPSETNQVQAWSDGLAKTAAGLSWSEQRTRECLTALASRAPARARQAERLVLGLDRLLKGLPQLSGKAELNQALDQMLADVQSLPDFNPTQFATHLHAFHASLADVSR